MSLASSSYMRNVVESLYKFLTNVNYKKESSNVCAFFFAFKIINKILKNRLIFKRELQAYLFVIYAVITKNSYFDKRFLHCDKNHKNY